MTEYEGVRRSMAMKKLWILVSLLAPFALAFIGTGCDDDTDWHVCRVVDGVKICAEDNDSDGGKSDKEAE